MTSFPGLIIHKPAGLASGTALTAGMLRALPSGPLPSLAASPAGGLAAIMDAAPTGNGANETIVLAGSPTAHAAAAATQVDEVGQPKHATQSPGAGAASAAAAAASGAADASCDDDMKAGSLIDQLEDIAAGKYPAGKSKAQVTKRPAATSAPLKRPASSSTSSMLGCGKCRGSPAGCSQCRDPSFQGARWQKED